MLNKHKGKLSKRKRDCIWVPPPTLNVIQFSPFKFVVFQLQRKKNVWLCWLMSSVIRGGVRWKRSRKYGFCLTFFLSQHHVDIIKEKENWIINSGPHWELNLLIFVLNEMEFHIKWDLFESRLYRQYISFWIWIHSVVD